MSKEYNFKEIENTWKEKWYGGDIYYAKPETSKLPKKYVLVEFPYPSGTGLHIGHTFSFTGGDVYARFMRMKGFNVLFPMGWDAFGLPTENHAIKMKRKPQDVTAENTATFKRQMQDLGFSFDWSREVNTTDPDYYKWTQWIFIKLFEKGLAYKKEMPINWCPSCKIGLANEEVVEGKCERCGTETSRRNISQWVVKITDYADRLAEGLKDTDFIEKVKAAQINWIGRKEGLTIDFMIEGSEKKISCFTKYPETIFGVSWVVVSPEYAELDSIVTKDQKKVVDEYVKESRKK
ncbi:MAG TPA: class I tRNA ligase family protein, partial [Candidatus Dojkabacteria bacterium]|nr:class I tRNA ligase family protein [Candidatus Dojkabacteria bacterium]